MVKFATIPHSPQVSSAFEGVTFLARHTYHVVKLAMNREEPLVFPEDLGKMWAFAPLAWG